MTDIQILAAMLGKKYQESRLRKREKQQYYPTPADPPETDALEKSSQEGGHRRAQALSPVTTQVSSKSPSAKLQEQEDTDFSTVATPLVTKAHKRNSSRSSNQTASRRASPKLPKDTNPSTDGTSSMSKVSGHKRKLSSSSRGVVQRASPMLPEETDSTMHDASPENGNRSRGTKRIKTSVSNELPASSRRQSDRIRNKNKNK